MVDKPRFTHRTVNLSPPAPEQQFAKTLFDILSQGIHDLPGIVAALDKSAVRPTNGTHWTAESFTVEVERLGAYPNSVGAAVGAHPASVVPQGTSSSERMRGDGR